MLVSAILALVVSASAAATTPANLTGELLTHLPPADLTSGSCNPAGSSTFGYTVTGTASGPYPGTFTETGTVTIGPQTEEFVPGQFRGDLIAFSASVTITSAAGTVTATKSLAAGFNKGVCFTSAAQIIASSLTYTAAIVTPTGNLNDQGTAFSNFNAYFVNPGANSPQNQFRGGFTSTSPPPSNDPPSVEAGGPYAGDEGAAIALDGTVSDPDGDSLTTSWAYAPLSGLDAGASCSFGSASAVDTSITCTDDGSYTVTLTANDGTNPAVSDSATVVVSNVAPDVDITAPSNGASFAVSATVNVSATLSDDGTNDTHTCSIDWADTSSSVGSVSESSGSGTCSGSHAYAAPGSYTIEVTVTDDDGDSGSDTVTIEVVDPNDPPAADAGGPYAGNEGAAIALDGTVSDPDGDSLTTSWAYTPLPGVDAGASCSFGSASAVDTSIACTDDGSYTVTLTANDGTNPAVSDSATVVVSNVAPTVNISSPSDGALYQINATVNVAASLSDAGTNDTHSCSINWENGTTAGSVSESNGSGTCSGSRSYAVPGVYSITVTVTDDDGAPASDTVMVVVFDPSGGFVTGGGWIDSPAGALVSDPSATGRANFGFVSRYKKGASVPEGQTEFQFQAGDLNFHSSSYQWLVVNQNGCRAQFKGTGTVNGSGSYGFMLWAYDGNCSAEPGPDKFRIKIWNGADENAVVYDNGGSYPNGQPLGGGSVVVNVKK